MLARAYLLKPTRRDNDGAPLGLLVEGIRYADPIPDCPPSIRVALRPSEEGAPTWARLVSEATIPGDEDLLTRTSPGAVFVIDIADDDRLVAVCFGSGRFLLRRSTYVPGFGLRAALNAAVASGEDAIQSIGWVTFRTADAIPVDGRLRGSTPMELIRYGVTPGVDRVRGVRVQRLSRDLGLGSSLEGATSLGIDITGAVVALPALAARLHRLGLSEDFRRAWPHVDDLITVEDVDERTELDAALQVRLEQRALDDVFVGLPDDAEGYSGVTYGGAHVTHDQLDLGESLDGWRGSIDSLRSRMVTFTFDDDRSAYGTNLYDLLVVTERRGDEEFHLADGDWFRLRAGLLDVIDQALDDIPEWEVELPPWRRAQRAGRPDSYDEGIYLQSTAADRSDFVLMDRKNVRLGNHRTTMEVCDLVHDSGAMVHAKRLDTKGLSHLASQVHGSAIRWSREPAYRNAVLQRICQQARDTNKDVGRFTQAFDGKFARQAAHPQILAIGAVWENAPLSEAVTALAKVQIHRTCVDLMSRGFDVRLAKIPLLA